MEENKEKMKRTGNVAQGHNLAIVRQDYQTGKEFKKKKEFRKFEQFKEKDQNENININTN